MPARLHSSAQPKIAERVLGRSGQVCKGLREGFLCAHLRVPRRSPEAPLDTHAVAAGRNRRLWSRALRACAQGAGRGAPSIRVCRPRTAKRLTAARAAHSPLCTRHATYAYVDARHENSIDRAQCELTFSTAYTYSKFPQAILGLQSSHRLSSDCRSVRRSTCLRGFRWAAGAHP